MKKLYSIESLLIANFLNSTIQIYQNLAILSKRGVFVFSQVEIKNLTEEFNTVFFKIIKPVNKANISLKSPD
ncbi:hypothetical protein [Aquiflexum gelatinilyticum]|uniref:hypothetical protein n=1 Tax=Aquiflexum gelatinilyticum TaxID=2961943 RepID=UPI0021687429|nr:hypothetical protein [Aquiflexum gelatinilyticum]MCS4432889.1 hypothetical protein [Aquiflexum gelatinilyticum]